MSPKQEGQWLDTGTVLDQWCAEPGYERFVLHPLQPSCGLHGYAASMVRPGAPASIIRYFVVNEGRVEALTPEGFVRRLPVGWRIRVWGRQIRRSLLRRTRVAAACWTMALLLMACGTPGGEAAPSEEVRTTASDDITDTPTARSTPMRSPSPMPTSSPEAASPSPRQTTPGIKATPDPMLCDLDGPRELPSGAAPGEGRVFVSDTGAVGTTWGQGEDEITAFTGPDAYQVLPAETFRHFLDGSDGDQQRVAGDRGTVYVLPIGDPGAAPIALLGASDGCDYVVYLGNGHDPGFGPSLEEAVDYAGRF